MSSDEIDDELLRLELEGLEAEDLDDAEDNEYCYDPNCFSRTLPELEWQWDHLEEFSGDSLTFNCHFLFRNNGLFINEQSKVKHVDISRASCKFDQLLDFLEVLLVTQKQSIETLRLPNFEESFSCGELFEKLKEFPSLVTLDFSHCLNVELNTFEKQLFQVWGDWKKLSTIILPLKLRADQDFDSITQIKSVPLSVKTIHLGICSNIPDSVFTKLRSISIQTHYLESPIALASYRKVDQSQFNSDCLVIKEPNYIQAKDDELTREEISLGWDCSVLRNLTVSASPKIRVAILDSGLHICHTSLSKKARNFRSFVVDQNGAVSLAQNDQIGRGTHCAGILSMLAGDRIELLIGKVCSDNDVILEQSLLEGIQWATSEGADIICILSSINDQEFGNLYKVVNNSLNAGKIIITAATGSSRSSRNLGYPAKFGNTICVAAEDGTGLPLPSAPVGREIEFLAPGKRIWSMGITKKYYCFSGAAQAAAHVTGLCAMLLAFDRNHDSKIRTCEQMKNLLRNLSTNIDHHTCSAGYGTLLPTRIFRTNWSEDRVRSSFNEALHGFDY